ncbi:MAG: hypothetical protein KDI90_10965 [Alphaproteobacteria bacterium]|nr:hypothetical protein [Alphaproteobacteria bacterium]MCB9974280.1 hypothetical protein [Rhodospirillales bacterium]
MTSDEKSLGRGFADAGLSETSPEMPQIPDRFVDDFLSDPAALLLAETLEGKGLDPDQIQRYLTGLYRGGDHRIELSELTAENENGGDFSGSKPGDGDMP